MLKIISFLVSNQSEIKEQVVFNYIRVERVVVNQQFEYLR